jgi:apolipoprotein N-acyltransferase
LNVCILQGNIPFENDLSQAREIFRNFYYPKTADAFRDGAAIVIWPESPTPYSYLIDSEYQKIIQTLCRQGRGALVLSDITHSSREGHEDYYNSALFLNEQGVLAGRYNKHFLVPYGEYIPMAQLLGFADALTREVSTFQAGLAPSVVPLKGHAAGAFICYESIFPQWVSEFTRHGASWLASLTNDFWYGNTAAPFQHLHMAIVRAIENRRYLVRAANSGISAVIAPSGEVIAQRDLFTQGVLRAEIQPLKFLTFYVQAGDFLPLACAIISVLWIVSCLWRPSFFRKNT